MVKSVLQKAFSVQSPALRMPGAADPCERDRGELEDEVGYGSLAPGWLLPARFCGKTLSQPARGGAGARGEGKGRAGVREAASVELVLSVSSKRRRGEGF